MFYLGIDVGKNTHVASLMNDDAKIIFKAFSFPNTLDAAEELLHKLKPYQDSIEIGMEATGHYWLSLYSFLIEHNFTVHVVNPIQTDGWRKGVEIRKRKTDTIDSVLIADLIRYGDFLETSLSDEDTMSLRNLSRFRNYLVSSISDLKRKSIAALDQVFPEYASVFTNVFGKTSKELLRSLNLPSDYEELSSHKLEEVLSGITMKKKAAQAIDSLSEKAGRSFGVSFCKDSFSFQLKLLIEQICFIEDQVISVEAEIDELMSKMDTYIQTIPGIGSVTGAVILGEIGDIERFDNPSKLVAYAGLDSSVSQSGQQESVSGRLSKRGSPYLRKALYQAALRAEFCDPVFHAYYEKKRGEGKHHLVATNAVARKLCHTIFAILKNNTPYEIKQ